MERSNHRRPELTDPATVPNPQINALMRVMNELFAVSMQPPITSVSIEYSLAISAISTAVGHLMCAKNIMAGEDDGEG